VVEKAPGAFKTIGELSDELGVAQHILRYWETRFPELKPLQRAGNRRYYRPADVELARRIHRLLPHVGYTVRGVQKVLRRKAETADLAEQRVQAAPAPMLHSRPTPDVAALRRIRNILSQALEA
jgi:DNA-binding transcriptional MerR regulator